MIHSIKGIVPPMVTPLLTEDKLDIEGLERLIEHLISGRVHGLFILGTTGEGPSLKYSLRVELIKRVCEQVNGRIPVLVGITDASFKQSVFIAEKSKEFGAQAVVLAPPFYFPITQKELYDYTLQLIRELPLPVYLYNQPALTKVTFSLDILIDLIQQSKVVGLKDSSGDMIYFQKLKLLTEKFDTHLLCGPGELLMESLVIGGDGGVPGGANVYPELYTAIYEAVLNNELDEALRLNKKVLKMSEIVYSGGKYGSSGVINGIKFALFYLNICNNYLARPLGNISQGKAERIKEFVESNKREKYS